MGVCNFLSIALHRAGKNMVGYRKQPMGTSFRTAPREKHQKHTTSGEPTVIWNSPLRLSRVCRVFVQIRQRNEKAQNQVMCTARPSWRSMTIADMVYKNCMFNVDVHLDGIISIDGKTRVTYYRTVHRKDRNIIWNDPVFNQHMPFISNRYNQKRI